MLTATPRRRIGTPCLTSASSRASSARCRSRTGVPGYPRRVVLRRVLWDASPILRTDASEVAKRARRRSVAACLRVSAACVAFMGDRQEGQKQSGFMVAEVRRSERDAVVSSASSVPHHGGDLDRLRYPLE